MNRAAIIFAIAAVVGVISCQHEPIIPDYGKTISPVCDPDTVYFVNDVLPFINANCAQSGCHDTETAEHGIILSSYNDLKNSGIVEPGNSEESDMIKAVTQQDLRDIMPPPSSMINLTDDQIEMLAKWIDQGARNNACLDLVCDSVDISFSDHILPLIEQRCKGCHLGTGSVGGFAMTNYEQISQAVNFGLYQAIDHQDGITPMPLNLPQLDSCKLQLVRVWIDEGALNN